MLPLVKGEKKMSLGASDQQTYEFGYGDGFMNTYTPPYVWLSSYMYANEIEDRFADLLTESYESGYKAGKRDREIEQEWSKAA
jgi:hypothetical protein